MVGRGREVGRGKDVRGPSSSKAGARGGVRASFVASTNDSYIGTRQRNGQWNIIISGDEFLSLTRGLRIHSFAILYE